VVLSSLLLSIVSYTALQFDYLLNQSEITELFCINKDKPEMQCNGKCHLKKQFDELADKADSPTNPEELKESRINLFFEARGESPGMIIEDDCAPYFEQLLRLSKGYSRKSLEPPQV
jgi:hypothetical protein